MEVEIRQILHSSPEFALAVSLRSAVLREPLGLRYSAEELAQESGSIHLGAFRGPELLGCLTLLPLPDCVIKMRQVAVDPNAQGEGVGKQLVHHAEALAIGLGFERMILHARDTAVPFYLRLGYEVCGEQFVEVTLLHHEMRKLLKA